MFICRLACGHLNKDCGHEVWCLLDKKATTAEKPLRKWSPLTSSASHILVVALFIFREMNGRRGNDYCLPNKEGTVWPLTAGADTVLGWVAEETRDARDQLAVTLHSQATLHHQQCPGVVKLLYLGDPWATPGSSHPTIGTSYGSSRDRQVYLTVAVQIEQ